MGTRRSEDLFMILTQEEAWEMMSRCLNSPEPDNETSRGLLRKVAKLLQCAQMECTDDEEAA